MNYRLLLLSSLLVLCGQTIAWFQFNIQFKYPKYGPEWWGWYVLAIPSTWFFIKSAQLGVAGFDGSVWANRFLGFVVGIVVYTILTQWYYNQTITPKIALQLLLAFSILGVQAFWKGN